MFTGLVAGMGEIERIDRDERGARITLRTPLVAELELGDSIAVSGACLTAAELGTGTFRADVMNQTLELTTLGGLGRGDQVNLEPALRASDRLGGHIVQGHVDAVGEIVGIEDDGFATRVTVRIPERLARYVVERGSIALDGVSLTIAALRDNDVEVSLIPETKQRTTFGAAEVGSRVNVEVDLIARHAERLLDGFAGGER